MIFSKALEPTKVKFIYDDQSQSSTLADLTVQMVKTWVDEYAETDSYILSSVVEILETLMFSQRIWAALKQQPIICAKLLNISKRPQLNSYVKTKIVSLVSQASKPAYSVPNLPVVNPDSFTRGAMEEHKMGAYMTGNPLPMSYTVDTAYNNRDITKSYTERIT